MYQGGSELLVAHALDHLEPFTNDWIDWVSKEFFLNTVSSYLGDNIKYNYIEKLNIE